MELKTNLADSADFVTAVYRAVLGRDPESAGLDYYTKALRDGTISQAQLISAFLQSAEYRAQTSVSSAGSALPRGNTSGGCTPSEALAVFQNWECWAGPGKPGFITNFLGGLTDVRFGNWSNLSGVVEGYPIQGNFHGDTLEWVGVLSAVLEADGAFSMIELGAGWGPWCVIGYKAARQRGLDKIKVIGVEGDAGHIEFMRRSFETNELPPDCAQIIAGVVGVADGAAFFPKVKDGSQAYGGAAAYEDPRSDHGPFADFVSSQADQMEAVEKVPSYSLATLLKDFSCADLVHFDIQGEEANVLVNAIDVMTEKAKRLVVGTHTHEIDRALLNFLPHHGWRLEAADACVMDEIGGKAVTCRDGAQVWRNSRL